MNEIPHRIILDTNIWISYLISSKFIKIDILLETGSLRLIFSEESLGEFLEVVKRPKFQKFFSEEDVASLLELFGLYGEIVDVTSVVDVCRDPKDNFLLALAMDSGADYLITGDKDLLELKSFEGTEILTITEFEKILGG